MHEDNDAICAAPWVHQVVGTHGELRMCCFMAEGHGHVTEFEEGWNSEFMRRSRLMMMQGKKVPECFICYNKEKMGQESARTRYNNQFLGRQDIIERIEQTTDGGVLDEKPIFLEVRFGNLCNLTCKMCNGLFSSQIAKDALRLKQIDPEGYDLYSSAEDENQKLDYTWYELDEPWEYIDSIIPMLEVIHIAGGEPTLIQENMDFLRRCIDMGYAKNIRVHTVTNATNINQDFLDLIEEFEKFSLTLSIDSVGPGYEYIRYPGNWEKVRDNVERILETSDSGVCFNLLVQAFNILDLPEILDEMIRLYSQGIHVAHPWSLIRPTCITGPDLFALKNLPPNVRELAAQRLKEWMDRRWTSKVVRDNFEEGGLDHVLGQLEEATGPGKPQDLLNYCKYADQNKKATLGKNLPELKSMLEEAVETD